MRATFAVPILAILLAGCSPAPIDELPALPDRRVADADALMIEVSDAENRAVSFTNKRSAYFYTQTHRNDHPEHTWFAGLNLAQRRLFSGYEFRLRDDLLDWADTDVAVYPDRVVRTYNGWSETLRLLHMEDAIEVTLATPPGIEFGHQFQPYGEGLELLSGHRPDGLRLYSTMDSADHQLIVGTANSRHYIIAASRSDDPQNVFSEVTGRAEARRAESATRLAGLLNGPGHVTASDEGLQTALRWIALTTDQLVTRQSGDGIYAGLPWFNEYWGRDSFIALPGALLVTGEFETARNVLLAFAEFQDMDTDSEFYGRVPNRVRPDDLNFHTTDGTPRFVIALHDYVRYSGDASIIAELWPNVRASIEGSLANWTDETGYLTHQDNETWMDARRQPDLAAYSPRDTRANDIQALWHGQLLAGVYFALRMGAMEDMERWQSIADGVAANFERDFTSAEHDWLADRLDADNAPDFSLRPNQFYALDMIADETTRLRATRSGWENLVFPWGVASLAPRDERFHPYHLAWDQYHKDSAYHNGTIWLWNNGIAMQRMIEADQVEPAWQLFQTMNRQALELGVVGGLGENMDAYPRPGEDWPLLTGTYLQAWSNTEHLRVWYQHFLGIRPDMIYRHITLAPRLPSDAGRIDASARIGEGTLRAVYDMSAERASYDWVSDGLGAVAFIDLPGFHREMVDLAPAQRIRVDVEDNRARLVRVDHTGRVLETRNLRLDRNAAARRARADDIFAGIDFARPGRAEDHPIMQDYADPAGQD